METGFGAGRQWSKLKMAADFLLMFAG